MDRNACLGLLPFLLLGCGGEAASGSAVGSWGDEAGKASLEMKADGSFAMDTKKGQHITGTWKLDGEKIELTGQGGANDVAGTFAGTLKDGEIQLQFGPSTMVLRRR